MVERERILRESAAAADAAVNQHFQESLRRASQKVGADRHLKVKVVLISDTMDFRQ